MALVPSLRYLKWVFDWRVAVVPKWQQITSQEPVRHVVGRRNPGEWSFEFRQKKTRANASVAVIKVSQLTSAEAFADYYAGLSTHVCRFHFRHLTAARIVAAGQQTARWRATLSGGNRGSANKDAVNSLCCRLRNRGKLLPHISSLFSLQQSECWRAERGGEST